MGALTYYTFQSRNWRLHRNTLVNSNYAIPQTKKEIEKRLDFLKDSKRARRLFI